MVVSCWWHPWCTLLMMREYIADWRQRLDVPQPYLQQSRALTPSQKVLWTTKDSNIMWSAGPLQAVPLLDSTLPLQPLARGLTHHQPNTLLITKQHLHLANFVS